MSKKIYLLAGHNGKGSGAAGFIDEGEEAIVLRDRVAKYVTKEVVKDQNGTKLPDVIKWLTPIVQNDSLLIEIHFDASGTASANGSTIVIDDNSNAVEKDIAAKFNTAICDTLKVKNRGIWKASQTPHKVLGILRYPKCNNVLIEVCFCTNKEDVAKYITKKELLAKAIAKVINEY